MAEAAMNDVQAAEPKPARKQERVRSTIDFPYTSLEDGVTVAKAVQKLGGNQCRLELLAAELGHDTANSGGFRQKLSTAHTFGLTSLSQGIVSLSTLGNRIVDPEQEKGARAEAFLKVPLYNAIYEEFKGGMLPPAQGLETKMVALGVAEKQKDKARQAFQKSAKEAGFFAYGTTKLVYPALGSTAGTAKPKAPDEQPADTGTNGKNGNGSGNDGDGGGGKKRHPLIEGLLETLPPAALGSEKKEWSAQERLDWLQTAAGIFNLVYKASAEDKGASVNVSITRPQ